jgi:hypothetical protein
MKYIAIYHANLNYAFLTPDKYEFVIRSAYELIFDTMRERFPNAKYVFEASGYTVEQIALLTPDVLDKLKDAIQRGQCEFMGSPYAHPMLPNFPEEDGRWSIKFSNDTYQRLLGFQPRSFWNPECGWRSYVPRQVAACGYANLIGDFEAYSRSLNAQGKPNRPEIYKLEHSDEPAFYSFGFKYNLPGHERAIHFPFRRVHGLPHDTLRMFLRTDRVAQFGVRHFMGMEGYSFENYLALIKRHSEQQPGESEGALIIFADDAEYVGTNGWFRLKYQNKPDNIFEPTPESRDKLIALVEACQRMGSFITFDEACRQLPPLEEELHFDDDSAWHGAKASFWAATPFARLLRPWQGLVREQLHARAGELDAAAREKIWYHLTCSYNSDGQWPPTLPSAPHIIHPFNYRYCFEHLLLAELLVGGVDRSRLEADSVEILNAILTPQRDLILKKADKLLTSGTVEEKSKGAKARMLLNAITDTRSVRTASDKLLYPAEYTIRADALVEARRLVGGVILEKVENDFSPEA